MTCPSKRWRSRMRGASHRPVQGFTLIELVVVMTLLTVIFTIASPQLGRFMKGRAINEECRRLAALVRQARSEAIARSESMELWINPDVRFYGMRPQSPVRQEQEAKPIEFELAKGVEVEVDATALNGAGEAVILFWPDGSIDENSPARVLLLEDGAPKRALTLAENRLQYDVEDVTDARL